MFVIPIGDSPNVPRTPWITWGLIAVNVLVFVLLWPTSFVAADPHDPATVAYLRTIVAERGVQPPAVRASDVIQFVHGSRPVDPSLVDALTSMFLHGGLLHLLGNMLFLWIFGDNVEHRLGRWWFLAAYLGTGLAATAGDTLIRWGSGIPSVGASGAISGVLGLYFAWFPHNRVRMWGFFFPFFIGTFELSARLVLGMYLVLQNLLPLLLSGGDGGVSYGAHIGGFLAGWGLAALLAALPGWERRRPTPVAADRPLGLADKVELGLELERQGDARRALAVYQRALAEHPRDPARAAAHLGAARVLLRAFASPTAAYQHLYAVLEESDSPAAVAAARELLGELRALTRTVPRRFLQ